MSILVATADKSELLESIWMGKESFWTDDDNEAGVDRWTKIIQKGKKQIFFEEQFRIDYGARTTQVESPTIHNIGGPSNNAENSLPHADSVKDLGVEALKAMEENEEKSLRVSEPGLGELPSEEESDTRSEKDVGDNSLEKDKDDNPSEEDGGATLSEEDGCDIPSEKDKEGGSKDDSVLTIANQVQCDHGNGDDEMDDTAEMYAAAAQLKTKMSEKAKTKKKKEKRARIYDGK
ncbi:unnamed protein product [Eruca vesicaria subsp. sativa]|uniref:Uncharacterized protein n=1 Tax=Eruca vesicaria subsp. sativa TaxID=29727 RepID=A0ABC8KSG1_ERUVS|nr:unnamed protein product [Eruca vesicaria subsp. sativa]